MGAQQATVQNGAKCLMPYEQYAFMGGAIRMNLPAGWQVVGPDKLAMHFPEDQVPLAVVTDKQHNANWVLQQSDYPLNNDNFNYVFEIQRRTLSRMTPGYEECEVVHSQVGGQRVSCLVYRSHAASEVIFSATFITALGSKMLVGTFLGRREEGTSTWGDVVRQSVKSLQISAS